MPYIYLTPMELSAQDLQQVPSWVSSHIVQRRPLLSPGQDPRASLTVSLAQGGLCARRGWDPQWPECGHLILTGTIATHLQVTHIYQTVLLSNMDIQYSS